MLRNATIEDVGQIAAMLRGYAEQGLLLPRSQQSICESILSFYVIEEEAGAVVGTAALHVLGDDLAEIRSLAIAESAQGKGYGRILVDALFVRARALKIPRVLALTYQETFFEKCGFHMVEKSNLQQKIWKDCINCKKFPSCDEIAMVRKTDLHAVHESFITQPLYGITG